MTEILENKENETTPTAPVVEKIEKKNYKSLGAMLKAHDFIALFDDLTEMVKNESIKDYLKTTSLKPFSELDELLFHFPIYATIKNTNEETGEVTCTGEAYPKVFESLSLLLDIGANPNCYMKNGNNAFFQACETNSKELLSIFVNHKKNPADIKSADGQTKNALYYAVLANCEQSLEFLVKECGLNINEKNFILSNQTPMFYACGHGKEKAFDKLLELGADLTIKDAKGYLAYEMMLPAYDEETLENNEFSAEELVFWNSFYEKAQSLTNQEVSVKKAKIQTKF